MPEHQVRINDELYEMAERRASEAGYESVDEYVAEVLIQEFSDGTPNLDHLFTPERLADIDKAIAEIEAGDFYTQEQADAELAKRRAEWIRKNHR